MQSSTPVEISNKGVSNISDRHLFRQTVLNGIPFEPRASNKGHGIIGWLRQLDIIPILTRQYICFQMWENLWPANEPGYKVLQPAKFWIVAPIQQLNIEFQFLWYPRIYRRILNSSKSLISTSMQMIDFQKGGKFFQLVSDVSPWKSGQEKNWTAAKMIRQKNCVIH